MSVASEAVEALAKRSLLSAEAVVNLGCTVHDLSRSHGVAKVVFGDGGGLITKMPSPDPGRAGWLRRECEFYEWARTVPALGSLVPGTHFAEGDLLVLELIDAENVSSIIASHGRAPPELMTAVGSALGLLHSSPTAPAFEDRPPWILTAMEAENPLPWFPADETHILSRILDSNSVGDLLTRARGQWQPRSLIHGDFKWDNCLVEAVDGRAHIRLLDWELAQRGDPGWDLGGAIAELWSASTVWGQTQSDELVSVLANRRLAACRGLLAAYANCRDDHPGWTNESLREVLVYAAARLIQTVFEYAVHEGDLGQVPAAILAEATALASSAGAKAIQLQRLLEDTDVG